MSLEWFQFLLEYVEDQSLAVLRIGDSEWEELQDTQKGTSEFSVTRRHEVLDKVRRGTICLAYKITGDNEPFKIAIVSSAQAVTTLDSRIKIRFGESLCIDSEQDLLSLLSNAQHKTNLRKRLSGKESLVHLSPKLSSHLLEKIASRKTNRPPLRRIYEILSKPKRFSSNRALQFDALQTAMSVFGISADEKAVAAEFYDEETGINKIRVMEDNVIEHDARSIRGWNLVASDVTGRARFQNRNGTKYLEVITANKRPLEKCFGVDLIYFNQSLRNIVMLQYKMLEPKDDDWIYRPDSQLSEEIERMDFFNKGLGNDDEEYRLHSGMFYLKCVKRDGALSKGGVIISLDHFKNILQNKKYRGPKGGIRISYNSLNGNYLRHNSLIGLIHSGYVGSYCETSKRLMPIIEGVLAGNRALVAAIEWNRVEELKAKSNSSD